MGSRPNDRAAQGGKVYVLTINITLDIGVGHTVNSMSLTGGAFGNSAPVIDASATANNAVNENRPCGFDKKGTNTDNDVSALGTYVDQFETTRVIASGKISGSFRLDDLLIKPQVSVSWFEETQETYTDALSNLIPEQTISLGEIRFGPNFSRLIKTDNGTLIQPSLGISGLWNFGVRSAKADTQLGNNQIRARLDGGLSFTNSIGWTLALLGFYDGLGINDYEAYGGSAKLTIPIK